MRQVCGRGRSLTDDSSNPRSNGSIPMRLMNCPQMRFQAALALLNRKRFDQAAETAAAGVCEFPDDGPLWELLGVAHQRRGQSALAREALEMATLLKPLDIDARFCLAEAYAATGSLEMAVFVYRMISDDARTPIWLLPKVASRLGEMEEYAHALGVCQLIVERDATRHEAHFGIGFYLRRLGIATERVVSDISRACELAPDVALYRVVRASLLHELGRHDEARELLRVLPLGTVDGPCSMRRMLRLFHSAHDVRCLMACAHFQTQV